MPTRICPKIVIFCLAAVLAASSHVRAWESGGPSPAKHTIGVIPYYSPEKIWTSFTPFIDYLRSKTGMKWELKLYSNHDELVKELCEGAVNVALIGPVPLGRTNKACGIEPLAVSLGPDGRPFYHSVIVTWDLRVRSLADLRGKRLGFFKGSTAAHVVPSAMLRDAGLGKGSFTRVFYESQDSIIMALLRGEIDAAGVKESLYRKFRQSGLRVVATSEPLPHFAFCAPRSLNAAARKNIVDALLAIDPRGRAEDQATTKTWDDEIKNGFILPPSAHLAEALRLADLHNQILHEDQ